MIKQSSINYLKERADIVEIIGSYIDLKKAGANYSALCPFHGEKTPSFMVSPAKNIFHCYGCGVGGDSIKFVMEYEKLTYPQALERLAEMLGVQLEYDNKFEKKSESDLLEKVANFYARNLHTNAQILNYLKSRGVSNSSIEKFQIGYSAASFETIKFIEQNALNKADAHKFGVLAKDSNGREYAKFSNRIIFPIKSLNGKIVGFGGRTLDSENPAKYLNSPQSEIFNKSKLLYGYDLAKDAIFKKRQIIVCEGYLDVIMLHQVGFTNAVATLGTALTREHIPILKKGDVQVIISYDGDKAGINAAFRAAKMLSAAQLYADVVLFKDGLDPADMAQAGRIDELESIFSKPMRVIEFAISHIINQHNISDPIQKQNALNEILEFLATLTPLLQDEFKIYAARMLKINPNLIKGASAKGGNFQNLDSQNPLPNFANTPNFQNLKPNMSEAILIVTLLNKPEFINFALEYIDQSIFTRHASEYTALLQNQDVMSNAALRSLSIDENLKPLETIKELKEHLRILVTNAYKRDLERLKFQNIEFAQKLEISSNITRKLQTLQQGELIAYENSNSTF